LIAAAALLALAGPTAAVCNGAPNASAADYLRDEQLHRTLRAARGVLMPTAPQRVTIYAIGGQVGFETQASSVAIRGGNGQWHTDTITRIRYFGSALPADASYPTGSALPAVIGERLDTILASRRFWRESPRSRPKVAIPPLHPTELTIDVVTPACRRRVVVVAGNVPPLLAQIVEMLVETDTESQRPRP
jgi:hypothetical protein